LDGKGNTLTHFYDEFYRLAEIDYPDGSYELFGYDANNNKIGFQTRSVNSVFFAYDGLNRMTGKDADNETASISYGYDYTGRLTGLDSSNDAAPYFFGYDTAGRAISQTQPSGSVVSWTVDANGNRTSLAWPETGALAYSTSYGYDAMSRLTDVFEGPAAAGVLLAHYSYDALSERTGIAYGGTTAAAGGRAPVATSAEAYTTAGQIAQIAHTLNGSALTLGYTYNQDRQRTGVSASDASFLVSGLTAATHAYVPNTLNQYGTVDATTYAYDANANLTSNGTWTYAYNTENLLLSATATGSTVSYDYDPQNLRRAKNVNGTTTSYLSIGNQAVGDQGKGQEIAEYDGSGNLLRRYVYGPGLDEPLATIDAAGNHSYHFIDGLGSVLALANASGQLTEKHAYSAFGLASSTTGTAFQFAGRRVDPETGLYYNRARYYSPALGRFLQTDPIGTNGGINLYAYTLNDPVNRIDPTGRAPTWMSASSVNAYGQMNTGAFSAANTNAQVQANFAVGQSGEAAVQSVYNIGDRYAFNVSGQDRISDGYIEDESVSEVKNVAYQGLTSQMKDYLTLGAQEDIDVNLYVRGPNASVPTTLSAPLQQQIDDGNINLFYIPGTQ
jgi:RHS repeat-associated protein